MAISAHVDHAVSLFTRIMQVAALPALLLASLCSFCDGRQRTCMFSMMTVVSEHAPCQRLLLKVTLGTYLMSVFLAAQEDARHEEVMVHNVHCMNEAPPSPSPPLPRTNRTSLVPPLVLSGHAASLTSY